MAKSPRRPSDNNLIPPINQQTISDFLQSFVPRLSRRRGRGKIKFSRSRIIYVVVFSLSGHQIKNVYIRKKQEKEEEGEKLLKRSPMGQFSDKVESDFGFLPFLILLTPYVCFEVAPKNRSALFSLQKIQNRVFKISKENGLQPELGRLTSPHRRVPLRDRNFVLHYVHIFLFSLISSSNLSQLSCSFTVKCNNKRERRRKKLWKFDSPPLLKVWPRRLWCLSISLRSCIVRVWPWFRWI